MKHAICLGYLPAALGQTAPKQQAIFAPTAAEEKYVLAAADWLLCMAPSYSAAQTVCTKRLNHVMEHAALNTGSSVARSEADDPPAGTSTNMEDPGALNC